jgi:hypothetical protein
MFFSSDTTLIEEILKDQVHGVSMVQKILSSSYIDLRERQRIADRVKQIIHKLKLQHVQGYKRLVEEINMVMSDSVPSASLSAMPMIPYALNPSFAAALQAKYIPSSMSEDASGTSSSTSDLYTDHIAVATEKKSSSEDPSHTSAE